MAKFRNPNMFEKILLVIGILVVIVGYGLLHKMAAADGVLSWNLIQTAFMWLIIIALIILTAVNENIKEELREIIVVHLEETKLIRKEMQKRK